MKVTIQIKDSNYLFARSELVKHEEDDKSKIAVVVASEKARDATTYIGKQLSDSQQVRLAMVLFVALSFIVWLIHWVSKAQRKSNEKGGGER